jgi:chorismate mutase
MTKLEEIRKKIDEIDNQLILLLEKRIALAIETKKFKVKFEDKDRENLILEKISNPYIKDIYKSIFVTIKKLSKND